MQLSRALRPRAVVAIAALAVLAPSDRARGDEATGTWTGQVDIQGNYYWETSTRVVAPSARIRLTSPDGTDLHFEYLVDAITSASIAAGVRADIRFTEVRNQATAGFGHEFDLGDAQLRLDLAGRLSHEPDYFATGVTAAAALALNQRSTVIGLSLGYIHDDVGQVIRGAPRTDGMRDLSNRGRVGQLEGLSTGLTLSQIITPQLEAAIGYDFVHNWGFLANPYRTVMVQGGPQPEAHPPLRTRHSAYGRIAFFIPESRTSLQALYRAYLDDWDIAALTPEARVYQEIGELVTLRLRYRYYVQTRSFFYRPPDQYTIGEDFYTADPKMSAFDSHLFGVHARLQLNFLVGTIFDFLRRANFWLSFDYLVQNNRFGNAVIAEMALSIPF
jgi:hypothetical protein